MYISKSNIKNQNKQKYEWKKKKINPAFFYNLELPQYPA